MNSMNAPTDVQKIRNPYDWVRTVRTESPPGSLEEYLQHWEAFFDHYAAQVDRWHYRNAGYHTAIASLARFYVPADARVLEVGSGNGDLLAALQPSTLATMHGSSFSGDGRAEILKLADLKRELAAQFYSAPAVSQV